MKHIFFICVSVLFVFSTKLYSQFGGGSGTKSDPYLISSKEHLQEISDSVSVSVLF